MPQMSTLRRKARLDDFLEIVDLCGDPHLLAPTTFEVEGHHVYVTLHLGPDGQRVVQISNQQFNSLIATRQVVYLSW